MLSDANIYPELSTMSTNHIFFRAFVGDKDFGLRLTSGETLFCGKRIEWHGEVKCEIMFMSHKFLMLNSLERAELLKTWSGDVAKFHFNTKNINYIQEVKWDEESKRNILGEHVFGSDDVLRFLPEFERRACQTGWDFVWVKKK